MVTAPEGLGFLCVTAASIGMIHTLLGPDHYLPFVAMARAGQWTFRRTLVVTLLCGVGHVLGSVALGAIGIAMGIGVLRLESLESTRADLAGWLLLAFGLAYFAWGVRRAIRNRPHTHWHAHADGIVHSHEHTHHAEHAHVHANAGHTVSHMRHSDCDHERPAAASPSLTPWILFTIFVFGPCEPLIPLLMYPAASGSWWGVALVTCVFGLATLATMTSLVVALYFGAGAVRWGGLSRYSHAMAGLLIVACGLAMKLGL